MIMNTKIVCRRVRTSGSFEAKFNEPHEISC